MFVRVSLTRWMLCISLEFGRATLYDGSIVSVVNRRRIGDAYFFDVK